MYRLVIPQFKGRVAPLFDVARSFICLEIQKGTVSNTVEFEMSSENINDRIDRLRELDCDMVICSAISRIYCDALLRYGIDFVPGVIGDIDDVVGSYLRNELWGEQFRMPGCAWRGQHGRRRCNRYSDYVFTINKREVNSMIIAITTKGDTLESEIDPRFGRAAGFIFYNIETGEHFYRDNAQNLNAAQGAGIQAAQNVVKEGCKALVSGNIGPKAFATLNAAGVEMYYAAGGSVKDVIEQYKNNKLASADSANVQGHW